MSRLNDFSYLKENMIGPNAVKLLEDLSREFTLDAGARVLDLGCGCGLSSVFLTEIFGVQVYTTDLWISATDSYRRFQALGLDDQIIPIHAEAHELPFAEGFFDSIVCIDAYSYFSAKDGFLDRYMSPLVKRGGLISVAIPGLKKERRKEEDTSIPSG